MPDIATMTMTMTDFFGAHRRGASRFNISANTITGVNHANFAG